MDFLRVPEELQAGVEAAVRLLGNMDAIPVRFEQADCLRMRKEGDGVLIGYSRKGEALRGLSMAKRVWHSGKEICQKSRFDTLTAMVDCSRNAVLTVEAVKRLMTELAMLGFTGLMLYTEDTYEIHGQPYFGHMRGRYTQQELKELDAYGREVGVELIPCIQTLAHLNAIFNWSAYQNVWDIDDILCAGDDRTYDLVEQMLKTCRECFASRKINIGMDEAHNLGRGRYLDKSGYSEKSQIMLRHLERVVALCKKYDFEPIIWSDMFFRMAFGGRYNVAEGELPQSVLDKIPEEVALCYWNYYTPPTQTGMLEHMFAQHTRTNRELWFAGGSWSWSGFTPKNYFSNMVTPTQLNFAEKYGVKNVLATAWGDDGAECSVFGMLPSFLQYGELNYSDGANLEDRCRDCFGISYADFMKLDQVGLAITPDPNWNRPPCLEKMALYNDVLLGVLDRDLAGYDLPAYYAQAAQQLESVAQNRYGWLFDTQLAYARLLEQKSDLSQKLKQAYRAGDRQSLSAMTEETLPQVEALLEAFHQALRNQWHLTNKPFGFEVLDIRLGGIKARLDTARLRLGQYLAGDLKRLEELEQADLPLDSKVPTMTLNKWRRSSTASVMAW